MTAVKECFTSWRTMVIADREIIDAEVAPEHLGPSPTLQEALDQWPGTYYWADRDDSGRLVLIRVAGSPQQERWWLHVFLFFTTFLTVWIGGALLSGSGPSFGPAGPFELGALTQALSNWLALLRPSFGFALALMAILLAHELGHYFVARSYSINVSLPYFLPAPPWLTLGTLGAFIRIRSPIVDRRQLMDVGAAGPWAGFLVAAVVLIIGLLRSEPALGFGPDPHQLVVINQTAWHVGDSLIMAGARQLLGIEGPVLLHPLALAGWFGLFVTMLNLLPLGQLDGGHVGYALLGEWQKWVARIMWLVLLVLAITVWPWWWLWAVLILVIGRGRIAHPAVLERVRPIPSSRLPLGWMTVALFVATFTPIPFYRV